MQIRVGMSVNWQGKSMICHRLYELKETRFAPWGWQEYSDNEKKIGNQKILHIEIDVFDEGDIINIEKQVVELVQFGKDIQYIIPYLKVKKEITNGSDRTSEVSGKAGEDASKGSQQGTDSGSSTGSETPGPDSRPPDGNG